MRHVTDDGLTLIKRFESFSPTIYVCPAGYETIGYGHVVLNGERQRFANGIDEDEAKDLLRRDAGISERAILRLIAVPLTDGQFDVLVFFVLDPPQLDYSVRRCPAGSSARSTQQCRRSF